MHHNIQHCESCGLDIIGSRKACPLCGRKFASPPENADGDDYGIFPRVPQKLTYDLIFKISTFVGILAIIVINIINYVFIPHLALYVPFTLGVICAWIILNVGFVKRKNIPKNIMYEAILSVLLCLIWDKLTGWYGWSVDYVLPATFASLTTFYFVMGIVDRSRLTAYAGYFTVSMIGTFITGIMMFAGIFDGIAIYFAAISFCIGVALLLAQIVFRGKMYASELHRWLHM